MLRVKLILDRAHETERRHRPPHVHGLAHSGRRVQHNRAGRVGRHPIRAVRPASPARSAATNPTTASTAASGETSTWSTPAAADPLTAGSSPPAAADSRITSEHAYELSHPEGDSDHRSGTFAGAPRPSADPRPSPRARLARDDLVRPPVVRRARQHSDQPVSPYRHAVLVTFEQGCDRDRGCCGRPVKFDRRRARAASRRRPARGRAAVSAIRAVERDRRRRGRRRMQAERGFGYQAERAVGPGVQLAEVVARNVLHDLAAGLGDGAVGPDHGDADQQVAGAAVAEPERAGRRPSR